MAGIYVKDNGTWKLPKSIWVNSGGWRVCQNVYVNRNGAWQEMIRSVTLSSNQNNFNLWSYVGSPTQPLSLIFNIASNVNIGSAGPTLPEYCPYNCATIRTNLPKRPTAFTVGNFPVGSTVIINNNGYISGGGGYGGAGGSSFSQGGGQTASYGFPGGAGGDAITKGSSNNFDCTLVNSGTIAAGGGGGGGSGSTTYSEGFSNGTTPGGNGGDGAGITGYSRTQGGPSSANTDSYTTTTNGGNGGNLGASGAEGQTGSYFDRYGGAGGLPGKAVNASGIELAVYGNIIGVVS